MSAAERAIVQPVATSSCIWPQTASWNRGELVIGGIRAADAVAEYGSPVYLLDEEDFRARCRHWRRIAGSDAVHYASKAFLSPLLARWLDEEGIDLDVCSPGEFSIARLGAFPPGRMFLHGNNKLDPNVNSAISDGVGCIVLDSEGEVKRVGAAASQLQRLQPVMVRLATGHRGHTHDHLATAHYDQKFGIPIEGGLAQRAISLVLGQPNLKLIGLHVHIGSQLLDARDFASVAATVAGFAIAMDETYGIAVEVLDLGGGYAIPYRTGDPAPDHGLIVEQMRSTVKEHYRKHDKPVPRLAFEPGRAIIGPSMVALYRVGSVKQGWPERRYVNVDGGMSDNPRPALYGARYMVALASRDSPAPMVTSSVCGEHCEAGDVLVSDTQLPADVGSGDVLAIPVSGAYQRSMASNYNYVARPAVVAVKDGRTKVLIRRETIDDMSRLFAEGT